MLDSNELKSSSGFIDRPNAIELYATTIKISASLKSTPNLTERPSGFLLLSQILRVRRCRFVDQGLESAHESRRLEGSAIGGLRYCHASASDQDNPRRS